MFAVSLLYPQNHLSCLRNIYKIKLEYITLYSMYMQFTILVVFILHVYCCAYLLTATRRANTQINVDDIVYFLLLKTLWLKQL